MFIDMNSISNHNSVIIFYVFCYTCSVSFSIAYGYSYILDIVFPNELLSVTYSKTLVLSYSLILNFYIFLQNTDITTH